METFDEVIKSAPTVVIELYADNCIHCSRVEPMIRDISHLTGPEVAIYQLDVNDNIDLSEELEIEGTPTFIIFKEGKEVWRWTGEIDGNSLLSKIQKFE